LDLQVLVIATNDHEQVFVMQEFVQQVLVLQQVLELQVLVLQRVLVLQAQLQLLVLEELHHVVLLQLVHSMKKLKKSRKKTNPKSLGYMF
jgi:hypothetical protein